MANTAVNALMQPVALAVARNFLEVRGMTLASIGGTAGVDDTFVTRERPDWSY